MKVIFLIFQLIFSTSASTHWVVTENGRIQSHVRTFYALKIFILGYIYPLFANKRYLFAISLTEN